MEQSEAPASSSWQDLILPAALATAAAIVAVVLLRRGDKRGKRLPPGPRPWPVFGNLGSLGKFHHQDLARLAGRYGPVFLLRLGAVNAVVVSSAELAEAVLKTHDRELASRARTTVSRLIAFDNETISFAPYGAYWRHVRKVFTLELFTARRMQQFRGVRAEQVVRAVLAECKDGTSAVAVGDKFEELAWNVISRMLISKRFFDDSGVQSREHFSVFKDMVRLSVRLVVGDYIPWLRKFDIGGVERELVKTRKRMDAILDSVLEERRQKISAGGRIGDGADDALDMMDVLLARPADGEPPLTMNQVKGILTDGFVAGTDTSSLTLAWATAELMRNPRVLERAQLELDEVVGHARLVTEADIPNLQYLRAIVKETFRLHPVAPLLLPHEAAAECELGGYAVPAGTRVFVNVWAIGRDPVLWERALEFWPERFLGSEVDVVGQDFALLPFGSGRRTCPGRPLGLITVQYGLAALLHACDLRLPPGMKAEDKDLSEGFGFGILATPLHLVAFPRLPLSVIRPPP